MAWQWDFFDTYRLNKEDVENYLTELFGTHKFYVKVSW